MRKVRKGCIWGLCFCIGWNILSGQVVYEKIYSNVNSGITNSNLNQRTFYDIIRTYDGGWIAVGRANFRFSNDSGPNQAWWWKVCIVKADSLGNIQWSKIIGTNAPYHGGYASTVLQTKDSGYFVGGWGVTPDPVDIINNGEDVNIHYLRLDKYGNVLWAKKLGGPGRELNHMHAGGDVIKSPFIQTKDNGYIGVSSSNSFSSSPDVYIFKLDSNGNIQWTRTIGLDKEDGGFKIVSDKEQRYFYILGYVNGWPPKGYVIKIDENGNLLKTMIDTTDSKMFMDAVYYNNKIIAAEYGAYYPSDSAARLQYIVAIDTNLNIIWHKSINVHLPPYGINRLILIHNVKEMADGNLLAASLSYTLDIYPPRGSLVITKFDENGNIHWNRQYFVIQVFSCCVLEFPIGLVTYPDNSFAVTVPTHGDRLQQTRVIKTDPYGWSCSADTATAQIFTGIQTTSGGSVTSVNQGTVTPWDITVVDDGKDSTVCFCPNIPFQIQKSNVSCYSQGSISIQPLSPGNYSYTWVPPVSTNTVATNLPAGTYFIHIMDSTGCKRTKEITITNDYTLPLQLSADTLLCAGQSTTLSATGADTYSWSTGETSPSVSVQPPSSTTYTLWAQGGVCTQSAAITIHVFPTPTIGILPFPNVVNAGDTVILNAYGATYYEWTPAEYFGANSTGTSVITPSASISFCVRGENMWGCADTLCRRIDVEGSCFQVDIPNVFTPNDDGVNDRWSIRFACPHLLTDYHLAIYDRWGIKLFASDTWHAHWDGRTMAGEPVPTGTYYYIVEYTIAGKKQKAKGYISLLR